MAERDDQQHEAGFKITDRRKFTEDGELRPGAEAESSSSAQPPKAAPQPSSPPQPAPPPAARREEEPPGVGVETPFERLVISFTSTAMMQLGLVALDQDQPLEPDLVGARETIDMLGVLQEKTRGNLTAREERFLKNALTELRMAYVEVQKQKGARQ